VPDWRACEEHLRNITEVRLLPRKSDVVVSAIMSQKAESNITSGEYISQQIALIRDKSITAKGKAGFFVSSSTLRNIEKGIDALMDGTVKTNKTPYEIEEMYNQLSVFQQRAQTAENSLRVQLEKSSELTGDLKESKEQQSKLIAAYRVRVDKIESDRKPLVIEINDLKEELKTLRSTKDSDLAAQELVIAQLKSAQLQLEAFNTEKKKLLAEKADMAAQVSKYEFDLKNEQASVARLQSQQLKLSFAAAAMKEGGGNVELKKMDPIPEPESATAKKILTPRTKALIELAAEAKRESVREQAHNLLQLAKSTDPRNYVGYKDYVEALFTTVKESKFHTRNKYVKLMDDLFTSMTDKKALKLKEIKALYKDIFDPSKEEVQAVTERVMDDNQSWWDAAKFDFWNWKQYRKPSLPGFFTKVKGLVNAVFSPVRGFFAAATSLWRRNPGSL